MTTYNTSEYLAEAIESILNNTYKNIEIVLVDDGSTDNSIDICKEYASKYDNIKIVVQDHAGVSAARNNGLSNTTGQAVHFMDGDDYVSRNFFENLLTSLIDNDADIATASSYNEKTNFFDAPQADFCYVGLMGRLAANDGWMRGAWAYLYKKDFLLAHDDLRFDTDMRFCQDTLFVVKALIYAHKVTMVKDAIYYYRWNINSSTKKRRTPEKEALIRTYQVEVGERLKKFAEEKGVPTILWERHVKHNFKKQTLFCEDIIDPPSPSVSPAFNSFRSACTARGTATICTANRIFGACKSVLSIWRQIMLPVYP